MERAVIFTEERVMSDDEALAAAEMVGQMIIGASLSTMIVSTKNDIEFYERFNKDMRDLVEAVTRVVLDRASPEGFMIFTDHLNDKLMEFSNSLSEDDSEPEVDRTMLN
jgi:hypothetical protein